MIKRISWLIGILVSVIIINFLMIAPPAFANESMTRDQAISLLSNATGYTKQDIENNHSDWIEETLQSNPSQNLIDKIRDKINKASLTDAGLSLTISEGSNFAESLKFVGAGITIVNIIDKATQGDAKGIIVAASEWGLGAICPPAGAILAVKNLTLATANFIVGKIDSYTLGLYIKQYIEYRKYGIDDPGDWLMIDRSTEVTPEYKTSIDQLAESIYQMQLQLNETTTHFDVPTLPFNIGISTNQSLSGYPSLSVDFNTVVDDPTKIVNYYWYVDNLKVGFSNQLSYTFTDVGNYTVKVEATDNMGNIASTFTYVQVKNPVSSYFYCEPTADLPPAVITLDATKSQTDSEYEIGGYKWDIFKENEEGDQLIDTKITTTPIIQYTFLGDVNSNTTYRVNLTVYDTLISITIHIAKL